MSKHFGANKIIFLIGAGASCDAGIKNSIQMIAEIEKRLEKDWLEFKDLYNYIESSHFRLERIRNKKSNDISFNIENLVGLLDIIIKISTKEFDGYHFVGSWEKEHVNICGSKMELASKFKSTILKELKEIWLSPQNFKTASKYYSKISQLEYNYKLKIFSLNYDMCVEENLSGGETKLERGFKDDRLWDYRQYDEEADGSGDFFLYKLHGSLDWMRDDKKRLTFVDGVQTIDPDKMEIIFGVQNKLQSYDPFNFYFYAFRESCFYSDLIVVSGYGFMDKHINDNLANAFKLDKSKKLLVNVFEPKKEDTEIVAEIARVLDIDDLKSITVKNKKAKEFFENDLNIKYFSSLFEITAREEDVLP